jgi:hypothetical protein
MKRYQRHAECAEKRESERVSREYGTVGGDAEILQDRASESQDASMFLSPPFLAWKYCAITLRNGMWRG